MKADLELVDEVKAGEGKAFTELVKRHQTALLRVCSRMTRDNELAEDIVQESFVKAYRKIGLFEGRSSFKSWLFQIAINTARNKLRSQRFELVNIDDVNMATNESVEASLIHLDVKAILRTEVEKLPEKQRRALELRIYEDLSFNEIAQIMECPYDTAKANYRHGVLKIKSALENNEMLRNWVGSEDSLFSEIHLTLAEVEG